MLTLIKTRGPQAWTFMAQEVIKLQIDPICWRTCFSFSWSAEGFITLYSPAGLRQTHFSWKLFWDLWRWTADQRDSKWARGAKHGILILNRERFSMELGVKMIAGVSTKPTFHFLWDWWTNSLSTYVFGAHIARKEEELLILSVKHI